MKKLLILLPLLLCGELIAQTTSFPGDLSLGDGSGDGTMNTRFADGQHFRFHYPRWVGGYEWSTSSSAGTVDLMRLTGYNGTNTLFVNGKVGIGTTSPSGKLDIKTLNGENETLLNVGVYDAPEDHFSISNSTNASNQFIPALYGYHTSDNRQALDIIGAIGEQNDSGTQPIVVFDSRLKSGPVTHRPLFAWNSYGKRNMTLFANGGLGIGISTPSRYKLNVWGPVRAHEVVVNTSGADFVFADDYALPTLQQVESFIKENRHLPEIPSAAEMQENGLHLAEMNIKLLQKVEELTLYMIDLNKEMVEKDKVVLQLLERMDNLEKQIAKK